MPTLRLALLALIAIAIAAPSHAKPVEFEFVAPESPNDPNPYSRELWARVTTPSGRKLVLPAYYAEGALYAVHARPDEVGVYRFGSVSETTQGVQTDNLVVSLVSPAEVTVASRTRLPSILRDPRDPRRLIRSDGRAFVPFGANLAWSPDGVSDRMGYYRGAFQAFAKADLNWMRVWMAAWDGMNLDWLPKDMGPSPRPGTLSEEVARNWDQLLEMAEANGVYVQVVLQHHGQYTTHANSDWAGNPWNAANPGGFLKAPGDFFTNANAQAATLLKYRYIVARWGWSSAVLSWELFNEVHWTDAMRDGHEADVARWHGLMAGFLRSVDAYGHLVTTSTENLSSPIFDKLDYDQPHLYPANMVAAARTFMVDPSKLDRPVFYGEEGGENAGFDPEVIKAGLDMVPAVWASVMGQGGLPAQPWDGWKLLEQGRLGEVGAVHRFQVLSGAGSQAGMQPFSSVVECAARVPLTIHAGEYWQRRAPLDIDYPLDGREPLEAGAIAATLVASKGVADGFPDRATYRLDLPRATTMAVRVGSLGNSGAGLRVSVDGSEVASHTWTAAGAPDPSRIEFKVAAGRHTLLVEDTGSEWIGIKEIDTGLTQPVLAAIGRRNDRFIAAWVWNRSNLYAPRPGPGAEGVLVLQDVPAGSWKVTWWDTTRGAAASSLVLNHSGGALRVKTPGILRHAAVTLALAPVQ